MPDLKTELSKVINQWNQPEEPTMTNTAPTKPVRFAVTTNVCRATFEAIRKNPGRSRKDVTEALTEGGFNPGSTTSIIGQLLKQNHVRDSQGLLYTNFDEYRPLKSSAAYKKLQDAAARKEVAVAKRAAKVAPAPAPKAETMPTPTKSDWSVDSVIGSLNVRQAMAVYMELRGLFGDGK